VITCDKKEKIAQTWLVCVLAMIGEQFESGDGHTGSVLTIGKRANTISLWTKTSDKKYQEKTERELCQFFSIPREKVRFQRHLEGSKSFCIKLSRSVDPLNSSNSCSLDQCFPIEPSPTQPPCFSIVVDDDDSYSTPFIDLTKDYTENNQRLSPTTKHRQRTQSAEELRVPNRHRKCLSDQSTNNGQCDRQAKVSPENSEDDPCSNPRMAVSIDSSSFRRWRDAELVSKPSYLLPKLHRRRGRRKSYDKSLSNSPRRHRLSTPLFVPETIPENKVVEFEDFRVGHVVPGGRCLGIAVWHWMTFMGGLLVLFVAAYMYGAFFPEEILL